MVTTEVLHANTEEVMYNCTSICGECWAPAQIFVQCVYIFSLSHFLVYMCANK